MKYKLFKYSVGIFALICVIGVTPKSLAAIVDPIQPMYVGISAVQPRVTINSSGKAICEDTIRVKSGYSVSITWELQSRSANSWGTIATWYDRGEGTRNLEAEKFVPQGCDYRLKTSVNIYNSQGVFIDTELKFSEIVRYS